MHEEHPNSSCNLQSQQESFNDGLFEEWLQKLDRKFLHKGRSIELIVDNCRAHPCLDRLRAIKLVFLPPNTTGVLQPCDQGIIQHLKCHYRKRVLGRFTKLHDENGSDDSSALPQGRRGMFLCALVSGLLWCLFQFDV